MDTEVTVTSGKRTSETDPLRIAEVAAGRGVVGITLCPGKQGDSAYGSAGIQLAEAAGELVVSDDTQMTLFTLEGMTRASGLNQVTGEINEAYLDWYGTQRRIQTGG